MECHAGAEVNLPVAVHRNPVPTQNRFIVFQETEGDGKNLEPSDSKMSAKEPTEGRKKCPSTNGQASRRLATQSSTRRGQSGEQREGSSPRFSVGRAEIIATLLQSGCVEY